MINLSETASNAMLDALSQLMDGGSIELLSDERVLAVLQLSDPATMAAVDGELEFKRLAKTLARDRGNAMAARILAADGSEIFSCDVGDENSDAVIRTRRPSRLTWRAGAAEIIPAGDAVTQQSSTSVMRPTMAPAIRCARRSPNAMQTSPSFIPPTVRSRHRALRRVQPTRVPIGTIYRLVCCRSTSMTALVRSG